MIALTWGACQKKLPISNTPHDQELEVEFPRDLGYNQTWLLAQIQNNKKKSQWKDFSLYSAIHMGFRKIPLHCFHIATNHVPLMPLSTPNAPNQVISPYILYLIASLPCLTQFIHSLSHFQSTCKICFVYFFL